MGHGVDRAGNLCGVRMDRRINGPGVTFRQEPRRPFDWAPVFAICGALLAGTLVGFLLVGFLLVLPLILQAPVR